MTLRGLRQHLVPQCTLYIFGLFLFLAGSANAQPDKLIDPTQVTEAPCPHRDSEVLKLHRGEVSIPTPTSLQIGNQKKKQSTVKLNFESLSFRNDSDQAPLPDRVVLVLDCAPLASADKPETYEILWNYPGVVQILDSAAMLAKKEGRFKVGDVSVNVTGDRALINVLKPYNGREVVLRLVKEPQGANRLLRHRTILKVILPPRDKK